MPTIRIDLTNAQIAILTANGETAEQVIMRLIKRRIHQARINQIYKSANEQVASLPDPSEP